ncbi:MAG TPA: hypothetical protein VE547_21285 [Mycobacteriales bacterium]|nr:hypothetical protein [Mycobacteriales bacterium]
MNCDSPAYAPMLYVMDVSHLRSSTGSPDGSFSRQDIADKSAVSYTLPSTMLRDS